MIYPNLTQSIYFAKYLPVNRQTFIINQVIVIWIKNNDYLLNYSFLVYIRVIFYTAKTHADGNFLNKLIYLSY